MKDYQKYNDIILYLEDIKEYVYAVIFYYENPNNHLDLKEIICYLKTISSIVEDVKKYINYLYFK